MIKSFTLLEILIVILILTILLIVIFPFFSFQKTNPAQETVYSLLHEARINALSGYQDSSWGVKITQNKVDLLKEDEVERSYNISSSEEKEFIFQKITGFTNAGEILDIYINDLGIISLKEFDLLERNNIDSRRVLIYYNRFINEEEKIILNEEEFLIQDFLKNNNLYLEKDNLLITTLSFNNPDTVFVVKRDRRYNEDPLNIYLQEDPNVIIQYSADGLETTYESLFVEKITWE